MALIANRWRSRLLPAFFRNAAQGTNALFHVEAGSRESGRRVVTHEFPKKNVPYTEDMGRRARDFTVRGYCIAYPRETGEPLYQENYLIPRDMLIEELEKEGPGILQLPSFDAQRVVCTRYRITEETRLGGYCTFDMSFIEAGVQPFKALTDADSELKKQSEDLKKQVANALSGKGTPMVAARRRAAAQQAAFGQQATPLEQTPLPPPRPEGL